MEQQTNNQKLKDLIQQRDRMLVKNDHNEAAVLCNRIGNLFSEQGKYEHALQAHEQELKLSVKTKDKLSQAIANRRIADCLKSLGQFDDAVDHCLKFKSLAEEVGDLKEVQRSEATMGSILLDKLTVKRYEISASDWRETIRRAERALDQSLRAVDGIKPRKEKTDVEESFEMRIQAFKNLSLIHELKDDEDSSIDYLLKYKEWAVDNNKNNHLVEAHLLLSQAYLKWKKPEKGLVSAKSCVNLCFSEKSKTNKERKEECLRAKGKCLIQLQTFKAAIKCFKGCWKMAKRYDADLAECLDTTIRSLLKIVKLRDSLPNSSDDEKCGKLEKLGDLFSSPTIDNLGAALDYYLQQENLYQVLQKSTAQFQPVYCSIAQTARDLNMYSLALEYFQKEMSSCGENPKELVDSLLNIALVHELNGSSEEIVNECFEAAANKARHVGDVCRIQGILENWLKYIEKSLEEEKENESARDLKEALRLELSQMGETMMEESAEQSEAISERDEEEVSVQTALEDYSEDSDVDEHNVTKLKGPKQRGGRRGIVASEQKNEHGETALHEAAKSGDLRRLKKLMEMKKQVNTHDFAGIAPIHDAALAGYHDVVLLLLKGGADVEDPGVKWKESKTPFLCAAADGHLAIMKVLLTYGAKTDSRDYAGRDYLDYLKRYGGRPDVEAFISEVENRDPLISLVEKPESDAEQQYLNLLSTTSESSVGPRSKDPSYEPVSSQLSTSEYETCEEPTNESSSDFGLENMGVRTGRTAVDSDEMEMYQREIGRLGSSAVSRSAESGVHMSESRCLDDEYVEDDWLIDDLGGTGSKTEKKEAAREKDDDDDDNDYIEDDWLIDDMGENDKDVKPRKRSLAEAFCEGGRVGGGDTQRSSSLSQKKPKLSSSHMKQTKLLPVARRSSQEKRASLKSGRSSPADSDDSNDSRNVKQRPTSRPKPVVNGKQSKITTFGVGVSPRSEVRSPVQIVPSSRVVQPNLGVVQSKKMITVKIENHAFLVRFPEDMEGLSVSWLCEEASSRYSKRFGSKPLLTACLQSGAMVDKDDPLTIFEGLSEISCKVDSWYVVGVEERYANCCSSEGVAAIEEVIARLKVSETDKTLDFGDVVFESPVAMIACLKTLNGHDKLHKLNLAETCLGEAEWSVVINTLGSLKSLKELNLAASGMIGSHVEQFAKSLTELSTEEFSICKWLRKMDISYNSLGDDSAASIATMIALLPNLCCLNLESVGLINPSPQLSAAFKASSVRDLNLSRNNFVDAVLSPLISSLSNCVVLNLSSIVGEQDMEGGFSEGLLKLTTNLHTRLQTLDISDNNIPKRCAFDVVVALCEAKLMHSISLRYLECLNDDALIHLLKKNMNRLKKIDVGGTGLRKPMKLELLDLMIDLFQSDIECFSFSHFHADDSDTLVSQWKSLKGQAAVIKGPLGRREKKFCLSTT